MKPSTNYQIEFMPGKIRIKAGDEYVVAELEGGNSLNIGMTFLSMRDNVDPNRADDFIYGVVCGLTHCSMTQAVPAVTWQGNQRAGGRLADDPDAPLDK